MCSLLPHCPIELHNDTKAILEFRKFGLPVFCQETLRGRVERSPQAPAPSLPTSHQHFEGLASPADTPTHTS